MTMKQQFQDVDEGEAAAAATDTGETAAAVTGTQAVDRGARLLRLVLESVAPVAVGDLAREAELPKSTASRLLSSLERHGLVRRSGTRGPIVPGPVMLRYARRGTLERSLAELAQAPLEVLARESGETVNLAVPGAQGVEHLAQVETRHFLGTGQWVGRIVPYETTAVVS
jgi:IclR family transcriptional regulator, acetate operon repressor